MKIPFMHFFLVLYLLIAFFSSHFLAAFEGSKSFKNQLDRKSGFLYLGKDRNKNNNKNSVKEKISEIVDFGEPSTRIVKMTKKIDIPNCLDGFNPSLIKTDQGMLLIFRYIPSSKKLHVSEIGLIHLDEDFNPIGEPQMLVPRDNSDSIPSQAEDARIFALDGKIFLIYNDNMEVNNPSNKQRRDMYVTEVFFDEGSYSLGKPLKIIHENKYQKQIWQKNWSPFVWNNTLLISYSVNPHEVLLPDFSSGVCSSICETFQEVDWPWGTIRGGTPAEVVDDEYLAFFHSGTQLRSPVSIDKKRWHYFMGAYTFSKEPPFKVTRISKAPIVGPDFYHASKAEKRVIFPGGYVVDGENLYFAYGKDDAEVWIGVIDKDCLLKSLTEFE